MRSLFRWSLPPLAIAAFIACDEDSISGPRRLCANPAPLLGQPDPGTPGYIVVYHEGTPPRETTERLARKYGFTPLSIYEYALQGFSAELTAEALAGIRCEAVVRFVEHNMPVFPAAYEPSKGNSPPS